MGSKEKKKTAKEQVEEMKRLVEAIRGASCASYVKVEGEDESN